MLLLAIGAPLAALDPAGPEMTINAHTDGAQSAPAVDVGAGVAFFAWESDTNLAGVPGSALHGRVFDRTGPRSADFAIVDASTSIRLHPAVAALSDGRFVVAWDSDVSDGGDTSSYSVQARRFDGYGNPLGAEAQVNSWTTGLQRYPDVAPGPGGKFLVVWHSFGSTGSDDSSTSIQARLFEADGGSVGSDVQVNESTLGRQRFPAVAAKRGGGFVVVWQDEATVDIRGRVLDATGTPQGSELVVSTTSAGFQRYAGVAGAGDGRFLVVWHRDQGPTDDDFGVAARRLSPVGVPVGVDFAVNLLTAGWQVRPAVDAGCAEFVVGWASDITAGTDPSGSSVQGRSVSIDGSDPVEIEVQVNEYGIGDQRRTTVASDGLGTLIVSWESEDSGGVDPSDTSIQARWFVTPFFCDGFESGDPSAWSSATGARGPAERLESATTRGRS